MKLVFSIRLGLSVLKDDIIDINEISLLIESSGTTFRAVLVEILALLVIFKVLSLLKILDLLKTLVVDVLAILESLIVIVIVGIGIV